MARDFTYIDDVIEGVRWIINRPANKSATWDSTPRPRLFICTLSHLQYRKFFSVQLTDYVKALEDAFGKEAIKTFLPMQAGDVQHTFSDVSDLERKFDYRPSTKLTDGLREFVKWYKEYNCL